MYYPSVQYDTSNKTTPLFVKYLMNEGKSSIFYSFNIYLKPEITIYKRSVKKLYIIIADGLPIINCYFYFFGNIANFFK